MCNCDDQSQIHNTKILCKLFENIFQLVFRHDDKTFRCWHFKTFNNRMPSSVQTDSSCILLTFDIIIMKATTKLRNPSKVSSTNEVLQKTLSSQSRSWLLRKLIKYRSSDQEGLRTPQFLPKMQTRN